MAFIGLRLPEDLLMALKEAAKLSGWSVSEQIRYELMERRGLIKTPYLPTKPSTETPVAAR